ncbi:MAG: N-acetylmuramidase family protein [Hyphomonadaceae bacterium JAD_PAG50586_4]|nr:MAG: N-acetylmuramidase family protein [Hyphomonadaceae bacterium JAD_PAG50586_4]
MSFWDSVFRAIFGSRGSSPPPPPPPARPPATPPRPPATPPAPPPVAPPASPPAAPPPPPPMAPLPPPVAPLPPTPPAPPPPPVNTAPPPALDPSVGFSLDALRATNAARLSDAEIAASAQRLGIEVNVLKAVIKVESAGPGFADNKPLLSFEPFWFSQATAGRFDASNPGVSQASNRAYLGGAQASRWTKLNEAFGLDPEAALGAASWGAFQLPGRYYADAGYSDVFAFVRDMAQSEARQLAAFEAYISRKGLADELQRRDWDTFARAYEGENGAGQYSSALSRAYATLAPPATSDGYIDSLVAGTRDGLTRANFEEVAALLGCEVEAIQAVVQVESGSAGAFAANGKPVILYEPHIFSRRTNRQYDASHPTISYRSWDATKYPRTQDGRWAQLREAYALNPQEAIASASYGLFQIMGFNHAACGFPIRNRSSPTCAAAKRSSSKRSRISCAPTILRTNSCARIGKASPPATTARAKSSGTGV